MVAPPSHWNPAVRRLQGHMGDALGDPQLEGETWVPLFARAPHAVTRDAALLLDSVGIPYVAQDDGHLLVREDQAVRARAEWEAYRLEARSWPPQKAPPRIRSDGVRGVALYAAILLGFHLVATYTFLGLDWRTQGRVDGDLMRSAGEWFRAVTALSLHGDTTHLVSNLVFGSGFGLLAAHRLGAGWAWLSTIAAGALGNVVNTLALPLSHRSLGASTGVFGALGVLMAYEWSARRRTGEPWLRKFAPPIAGMVLFGWLGMGDATGAGRVDVSAHAFGLIAGLVLGGLLGILALPERWGSNGDRAAGAAAILTLVAGWISALP